MVTLGLTQLYAVTGIWKVFTTTTWTLGLATFINAMAFPPVLEVSLILSKNQ